MTRDCVAEAPKILHYGLLWEVNDSDKYSFDKHWHYEFQATRCPPWDLEGEHTDAKGGLFPHPPRASSFNTSVRFDPSLPRCDHSWPRFTLRHFLGVYLFCTPMPCLARLLALLFRRWSQEFVKIHTHPGPTAGLDDHASHVHI